MTLTVAELLARKEAEAARKRAEAEAAAEAARTERATFAARVMAYQITEEDRRAPAPRSPRPSRMASAR